MKNFMPWIVVGFVTAATVGFLALVATRAPQQPTAELLTASATDKDVFRGNKDAPLTLVEYADFQCPACAVYHPLVRKLEEEFGGNLKVVFRQFPLNAIHENADLAARASEAANLQGKFWEMHDMLFEHQQEWAKNKEAKSMFLQYAFSAGLNQEQFARDLDDPAVKEKISKDLKSGWDSQVQGTPTFFLQGRKIVNPPSYDAFRQLILNAQQGNS
ncbi:MAG: DsbA family protein [Candidatus Wildermuthbacteria bacterium]|nr:DsbA family protein [Candidatus Wildermuthbacteria bacterium]